MSDVRSALALVQREVKASKGRRNEYGGYAYRSLEDINGAAKPVCERHGCLYWFTDAVVPMQCGSEVRWYVSATAHFALESGGDEIVASALAREAEHKKGMDDAQVTGLASSYARKYAACALFAIDSGEDPDQMDNREQRRPSKQEHRRNLMDRLNQVLQEKVDAGLNPGTMYDYIEDAYHKADASELTDAELVEVGKWLKAYEVQA